MNHEPVGEEFLSMPRPVNGDETFERSCTRSTLFHSFLIEEISRRPFSKQLRDVRSEETVSVFVILSTTYYPSLFHLNYAKHGRISVFGQLLVVGLSAFNLR